MIIINKKEKIKELEVYIIRAEERINAEYTKLKKVLELVLEHIERKELKNLLW